MAEHGKLTYSDGIHIPFQWSYETQTEMENATGFTANDLHKLCLVLEDHALWALTGTTPVWKKVISGGGEPLSILNDNGLGGQVFKNTVGQNINIRSVKSTSVISITNNENDILIGLETPVWAGLSHVMVLPPTGSYVCSALSIGGPSNIIIAAGGQRVSHFLPARSFSIDRAGVQVSVGSFGQAGYVIVFDSDVNGRPTTLLGQSGIISLTNTGFQDATFNFSFVAGKTYMLGFWCSALAVNFVGPDRSLIPPLHGSVSSSNPPITQGVQKNVTWGGTNVNWGTYTQTQNTTDPPPLIHMRVT